ncbi:MAG TPA: hypothetical protein VER58_00370 [Thermoanaerobaculia bacterium]|nr:hypothetical protein [Thermoanaerobaculia bacterium]
MVATLTIGATCTRSGVGERKGIIAQPTRPANGRSEFPSPERDGTCFVPHIFVLSNGPMPTGFVPSS